MKRRLFNLAVVMSLLLLLTAVMLWVRSYFAEEIVFLEERRLGPVIDRQFKSAMKVYQQHQGFWNTARKKSDRFWKDTRYELHISRGRIAFATHHDWCEPDKATYARFARAAAARDPNSRADERTSARATAPGDIAPDQPPEYVLTDRRLGHESAASRTLSKMLNIDGLTTTGILDLQLARTTQPSHPLWPVLLVGLPLPLIWLNSIRRQRQRLKLGCCLTCGYDLRATPQGGRCPECGMAAGGGGSSPRSPASQC